MAIPGSIEANLDVASRLCRHGTAQVTVTIHTRELLEWLPAWGSDDGYLAQVVINPVESVRFTIAGSIPVNN